MVYWVEHLIVSQRGEEGMNAAGAATFLTPATADGAFGKTFLRRCMRAAAPNVSSAGSLQLWMNNGGVVAAFVYMRHRHNGM